MEQMIQQTIRFYCLECRQLKQVDEASSLFRTGFYQVKYPLGLCVSCKGPSKLLPGL